MRDMPGVDEVDQRILMELRRNGRITLTELGKKVNLTPASVKNRLEKLMSIGAVKGYTAVLEPTFLDEFVQALIEVEITSEANLDKILLSIAMMENVLDVYRKTGEYQIFIRANFKSREELNEFLKKLSYRILKANLRRYKVSILLDQFKESGILTKKVPKNERRYRRY